MDFRSESLQSTGKGKPVRVREYDLVDYRESLEAMRNFAAQRDASDEDQIWLLQHPPVYTQGTACEMVTLLPSDIPVVKTDRGGQITYHGPGQWVMYPLLSLRRHELGVKSLVFKLEQTVIDLLAGIDLTASRRADAPGVYIDDEKIAALGLRIRRGNSYHGLSLNVAMDLAPFTNIDPCGYQGMKVTQISDLAAVDQKQIGDELVSRFLSLL